MATQYPLLPGYAPTQVYKENFRKVSHIKQQGNLNVNNVQQSKYVLPRQKQFNQPKQPNKTIVSTTHDHFPSKNSSDTSKLFQPSWVRLDRHVLRFYAYFKQTVAQTNGQNLRNRKVKIFFYLEDNSISINQQKHQNSGIPQGIFLKRQKALNSNGNGKFFTPLDFKVGEAVCIYGREYSIYNCDQYTRQFYQKLGQPQGPAISYENDQWTSKATTKWVPQKDADMKNYLQKKLGGGRVTSQKQFLQLDRKVLKFYSLCEGSKYIVHFFLADDTIEIREVSIANSGKDPFPVTVKRHKLPKQYCLNQPGQTYAQNFLTAEQLQVGQTLNVYGRKYYIEGCDDFTRYYYAMKYGKQIPQSNNNNDGIKQDYHKNIVIPPHNGIGSEEDSVGYIYKLVPKPPKKDFFQWVDQQVSLRFTAIPSNPKPEDTNRKFIITYYLNDYSLQIYEPPVRNSGMYEGKFLQRNKYKKQNGQIYKPEDIIVGQDVKINGHCFHVTDCDDFTKKWYYENTIWDQNK